MLAARSQLRAAGRSPVGLRGGVGPGAALAARVDRVGIAEADLVDRWPGRRGRVALLCWRPDEPGRFTGSCGRSTLALGGGGVGVGGPSGDVGVDCGAEICRSQSEDDCSLKCTVWLVFRTKHQIARVVD